MRLALFAIAAFLLLAFMPVIRWSVQHHSWLPVAAHVAALSLTVLFAMGEFPRKLRIVRDWLPMVLIPFMYLQLRFIIGGIGMSRKDPRIIALDRTLFGGDLWSTMAQRVHFLPISELLHLSYVSYYPLIAVPPILLWRSNRRREYTLTVLTLVAAYLICFTTSVIIPVDGPRFLNGPADAPGGPFRALALIILRLFSSRGSAFPSSHVAAAVAASYCALRFQRKVGYVVAVLTFGLAIGAVYGGLHYTTDIVAGAAAGVAAIVISRRLETPPARVSTAPESTDPVKLQVMRARMAQHSERRSRPLRPSKEIREQPLEEKPPAED